MKTSLFTQWTEQAEKKKTQEEHDRFWNEYLEKETKIYEDLLENHENVQSGKFGEMAAKYNMDTVTFAGFLDGINTSLTAPLNLEELQEESDIALNIDFEKLYYNMLGAKASWLYNLPQWDGILSAERRAEITKEFNKSRIAVSSKVGRNDPCPCGSGKKYKKCCGQNG